MTDDDWDERYQRIYNRLYPLASTSSGYFSIVEAEAVGFSGELRAEAIERGVCSVFDDAVMRLAGYPRAKHPMWIAAWLRCGRNRVMLSHVTALHVYYVTAGGTADVTAPIHVTISQTRDLPDAVPANIIIHRGDVTEIDFVDGLPVASIERTIQECRATSDTATLAESLPRLWAAHLQQAVTKGIELLPAPISPPHFSDPNLALAVIEMLTRNGQLVLPALVAADEYSLDTALYEQLAAYPFTAEQLASIERLHWEGGGMSIQHVVWPQWDGESDQFDLQTLQGIEQLVNLREVVIQGHMPIPEEELVALRERGISVTRS